MKRDLKIDKFLSFYFKFSYILYLWRIPFFLPHGRIYIFACIYPRPRAFITWFIIPFLWLINISFSLFHSLWCEYGSCDFSNQIFTRLCIFLSPPLQVSSSSHNQIFWKKKMYLLFLLSFHSIILKLMFSYTTLIPMYLAYVLSPKHFISSNYCWQWPRRCQHEFSALDPMEAFKSPLATFVLPFSNQDYKCYSF